MSTTTTPPTPTPLSPQPPSNNITLYHKHIISDIDHLQKRANRFMDLRIEFIRQKCKPIQQRILQLKEQIQHEKTVEQTSDMVMQDREDIKNLRSDVAKYQEITNYYKRHVDDLERMLFAEEDRQKNLNEVLGSLRVKFRGFKKRDLRSMHDEQEEVEGEEKSNNSIQKSQMAPVVSLSHHQRKVHSHNHRLPQIKNLSSSVTVGSHDEFSIKHQIQEKICSFNVADRLIKDCLEIKKMMIQRMIGQLQSRLVKKKRLFVRICEAISDKEPRKISKEEFKQLDADEIFTLIISFPSLTRKFQAQLQKKRQKTTEIMDSIR